MFSLVSGVYQWLFARPEVCILLVGLQGSGKTTFFEQLKDCYGKRRFRHTSGLAEPAPVGNKPGAGPQGEQAGDQDDKQRQDQWQQETPKHRILSEGILQENTQPGAQKEKDSEEEQPQSSQKQVGTTSLMVQSEPSMKTGRRPSSLPHVSPTTGLNFCRLRYKDVDVVLWDLAGLGSFHAIWLDYFQKAHCVLYFVDSTSPPESLKESGKALYTLSCDALTSRRQKLTEKQLGICAPPLLIVAAKQDLAGALMPSTIFEALLKESDKQHKNSCTICSEEGQQIPPYGGWFTLRGTVIHTSQLNTAISHSAYNLDSVQKLLQRAVDAAKAYHKVVLLPLHEFDRASNVASPHFGEMAPCEVEPLRRYGGSHVFSLSHVTKHKQRKTLQDLHAFPLHSDPRCPVRCGLAGVVLRRTDSARDTAWVEGQNPSGKQLADVEDESSFTAHLVEVPCWHNATAFAALTASSTAADPSCTYISKAAQGGMASPLQSCNIPDTAAATRTDALSSAVCASFPYSNNTCIEADAPEACQRCDAGSHFASSGKAELKREHSGLYELEETM